MSTKVKIDQNHAILIRNHLVAIPEACGSQSSTKASRATVATLLANIAHYGYSLSHAACEQLSSCSDQSVAEWWQSIEPVLKNLSGDDREMDKFVVYKNFPDEVLNMSEVEYWINQIGMYWGLPNDWFTEDPQERAPLDEMRQFRALHVAAYDSLENIFGSLLGLPNRWTEQQFDDVVHLAQQLRNPVDTARIPFKENMVQLISHLWKADSNVILSSSSATDVLRLATGLSDGDVHNPGKTKFVSFSRPMRKRLLSLLENSSNLEEDLTRRPQVWKKLMRALRPGDYPTRFPKTISSYDKLYNDRLPKTFNSKLEALLQNIDPAALKLLEARPGEFVRRLHMSIDRFGQMAIESFCNIVPQLTTIQLLKLQGYWETIEQRGFRTIAPRGNWTALQILPNDPDRQIDSRMRDQLLKALGDEIRVRVSEHAEKVQLCEKTKWVKLQTNDADLTPYGRGTRFPIPENVTFIRTASYWATKGARGNIWFDNGWNFFDDHWNSLGACCWNANNFGKQAATFSGDPTNSKDLEGRACQMIDLYPKKLERQGVRYALWNILAYSHIKFEQADEVYAALQWGESPQKGKLFEPSRCQLSFALNGNVLTKYIAYIDLQERELVYIDANLWGNVGSAVVNGTKMAGVMPAFVEYLSSLPSVYDLFKHQDQDDDGIPIKYSDAEESVCCDEAYVFRPQSESSKFDQLDLTKFIAS